MCIRELMLEVQDIPDICPPELIDRLVVVSYYTEIPVFSGKQPDKTELDRVCILVLIHHDVAEPFLIVFQHIGLGLQKLHGLDEKIVEIQRIVRLKLGFIFAVHLRDLELSEIASCVQLKLVRQDHLILRRRDRCQKIPFLIYFCVNIHFPADFLHQCLLIIRVIDRKTVVIPQPVDEPSQDPDTG